MRRRCLQERYLGTYQNRVRTPGEGEHEPADPPIRINVRVTETQGERIQRLFDRAARDGKADDRQRIRRGLIRILGRETLELAEVGGRPNETRDIRFIIKG